MSNEVINSVYMENEKNKKLIRIKFGSEVMEYIYPRPKWLNIDDINDNKANLDDLGIKDPNGQTHQISGIWPDEVVVFTNSPGCAWYWNSRKWIWR